MLNYGLVQYRGTDNLVTETLRVLRGAPSARRCGSARVELEGAQGSIGRVSGA